MIDLNEFLSRFFDKNLRKTYSATKTLRKAKKRQGISLNSFEARKAARDVRNASVERINKRRLAKGNGAKMLKSKNLPGKQKFRGIVSIGSLGESVYSRMAKLILEGETTGSNPFSTGHRVGNFIKKGGTPKPGQLERVRSKVAKRQTKGRTFGGYSSSMNGKIGYHEFNRGVEKGKSTPKQKYAWGRPVK